jgi:hypothetical protein
MLMIATAAVSVSPVHENMHQWTRKKQQPYPVGRQPSEEVRPVLHDKEKRGDGEETDQHPFDPGVHMSATLRLVPMFMIHAPVLCVV